jgi:mannose-1-phosphate guanylyltransferase/mannose-6-phosphate isomerase
MIKAITSVILCGGSGTCLWSLSRAGFSKKFLVLSGVNGLFQKSDERINKLGEQRYFVETNQISIV